MLADFWCAVAFEDEGIEAVKGRCSEKLPLAHRAALGSVRVRIVEMRKVGPVFQIPER